MISGIGESGEMPIGEMYRGENSGWTQGAENKARNTWKVVIDSFEAVSEAGRTCGKESICSAGDQGSILGREDPLEKEMATYSSILAWRIPWTEEPGRL